MPPEVGYAETSSDIVKPMIRMKTPRIGHDHEIEIGPPLLKPAPKLVKQPARIEMIENEIAKLENPDHERFRSCWYPSLARCFSSSVRWSVGRSHVQPPGIRLVPRVQEARPAISAASIAHAEKV